MSKTQQCEDCKKRYKVLTPEGLCYFCYKKKHGVIPTAGCYKIEKAEKK